MIQPAQLSAGFGRSGILAYELGSVFDLACYAGLRTRKNEL
jgi:hypothetical protein